jgi:hypothetical protein
MCGSQATPARVQIRLDNTSMQSERLVIQLENDTTDPTHLRVCPDSPQRVTGLALLKIVHRPCSHLREIGACEKGTQASTATPKWETYTLNETTDHSFRHTP